MELTMLCNTIPRYLQAELFSIWPIQFYPLLPVWPAIICRHFQFDIRPWQTRTHCCGHTVADTNVSPFARLRNICCGHKFCVRHTKNVSDFVQKHFVSATIVSQSAQPKKHHGKQCVRNNVSSFTRVLSGLKFRVLVLNATYLSNKNA